MDSTDRMFPGMSEKAERRIRMAIDIGVAVGVDLLFSKLQSRNTIRVVRPAGQPTTMSAPNSTASASRAGGPVAGHPKMQAVGPGWSQHREIYIDDYFRGLAAAPT